MALKYIYIGIEDHWVRCENIFGSNYLPLYQEKGVNHIANKICDTTCVVCGKKVSEIECLPRNY